MKRSRTLLALMPVAMVATLLTSCTVGGDASSVAGIECAPEGSTSKSIEITGEFGASDLKLETKAPVSSDSLQRSVLIEGDGDAVKENDLVETQLSFFNGETGELVSSDPGAILMDGAQMSPWVLKVLGCSAVGERVAATAPVVDVLGPGAGQNYGLADEQSVVLVFDVLESGTAPGQPGVLEPSELLEKAEGEAQPMADGLPGVELAADGSPTITIPEGVNAPTELTVETLIKGSGEEVQAGDRVYVHYRGVIWRTGEEFDSSWSRGEPVDFLTTGVIGGFAEALVGQTVGSQVMSVVPAEDGGYGAATLQSQGHEPDDVMVFVLDILGTAHAE